MNADRPPDLQPVLLGDLVELRPLRDEDWPEMFAVAADPLIWQGHPVSDRYKESIFRDFFEGAVSSRAALSIVDRRTGKIVGSSRYHGHEPTLSEIEIGWTFLARSHWGGAYNREVKRLMVDHAFTFVETVIFLVGVTNLRSQRAMEKIGGVKRGNLRDRAYNGVLVSHVVYELRNRSKAPSAA